MRVKLDKVKYAVQIEGGRFKYIHDLYLIMSDNHIYYTNQFKENEVIPSNTLEATDLGVLPVPEFVKPAKILDGDINMANMIIFDGKLEQPIYIGFGNEPELDIFTKPLQNLHAYLER